jgi:ethanolamine utilization protein EutM
MKRRSLGMIETWGFVPAIEAADAGNKAANVTFLGYEITKVALVTVIFAGEVAAVQAAVTAGAAAAEKVGKVVAVHVIPRPDRQLKIVPPGHPGPVDTEAKREEPPPEELPPGAVEKAEEEATETLPETQALKIEEPPKEEFPPEEEVKPEEKPQPVRRRKKAEPRKTKAREKKKKKE